MPNESVGKVLLTSETEVFGGHLTIPKYEVVDCGTFYEVTFFCISPKNLLGNFFYSLNDLTEGCGVHLAASPSSQMLANYSLCLRASITPLILFKLVFQA